MHLSSEANRQNHTKISTHSEGEARSINNHMGTCSLCHCHIGLDVCYFASWIQRGFQPNQITCLKFWTNPWSNTQDYPQSLVSS